METSTQTPRQEAEARAEQIHRRLSDIEWEIGDLQDEQRRLEAEVERIEKAYPPLPEVRRFKVGDFEWFTDGYQAYRGAWPGEFKEVEPSETLPQTGREFVRAAQATEPKATIAEVVEGYSGTFAVLSNGAVVRFDWIEGATKPGDRTIHSASRLDPIAIKDPAGEVVAILMPINHSPSNNETRRPYGA
jgi:hypothetical protein